MLPSTKVTRLRRFPKPVCFLISKQYCQDSSRNSLKDEIKEGQAKVDDASKKKEKAKQKMTDLLQSLSKTSTASVKEVRIFRPKPKEKKKPQIPAEDKEDSQDYPLIDFSMRKAVKEVAEDLGGDVKETESELLSSLRSHSGSKQNLSDLLGEMTVEKSNEAPEGIPPRGGTFERRQGDERAPKSRLHEYRFDQSRGGPGFRSQKPINIFGAAPLGIFPSSFKPSDHVSESLLPTWDTIVERENRLSAMHPPRNHFEEMIKWTEQGRIWNFPLDNEYGLEEEEAFSFADHIFLERHLEGWCPAKGPVRHFMELVCVGLSKNPHITVARKKAHIEWYRSFFESKQDLLKEVGAI